jgi:hypothetical protein
MQLLNKLERRFGRFAIRGLMVYIVGLNALVYVLSIAYPQSTAIDKLFLVPSLVMKGQLWRLVTFIFIPPAASIIWIFFILYFYYMVGIGLEGEWGSFRFNLYYLAGMIATILAAFAVGEGSSALYLNLSLFLAFAHVYPEFEVLLFFILPVKVKYLAWLNWAFITLTVIAAPLAGKVAALASVANYFLFFGSDIVSGVRHNRSVYRRRRRFNPLPQGSTIHRCSVCNMTEKDDPLMEFRYCSTCAGDYEYCMNHLKTHEHVKPVKGPEPPEG